MTDDHIRFITHQGKQILTVDLSNCSADRIEKILRELPDVVAARPLGSVLIFSDLTGASFDRASLMAMKETAVFNKPYVKKAAFSGAENFPREFSKSLRRFSGREFPTFKSREEALAWLVRAE
jgi:hypothetical protein